MSDFELEMMKRAIRLAERGRGRVEPNPLVGAVIVSGRRIVAEGRHERFGGPHAEIVALRKAGRAARGATMFVTLEPCSHYGKTPPCADAIIEAGLARVVAAMRDPFRSVSGRGFARLRRAGIDVSVGLCRDEALKLNAPYLKRLRTGLPFVTVKYAMTADGRIATATGHSRWISGEESRRLVHRMRALHNCVMVGLGTVLADDPELTVRLARGPNPLRVVADSFGETPPNCRLVRTAREVPTIVATVRRAPAGWAAKLESAGVEVLRLPSRNGHVELEALMRALGDRGVTTVFCEGGAKLSGALLKRGLADRLVVFMAPKLCLDGMPPLLAAGIKKMSRAIPLENFTFRKVGADLLVQADIGAQRPPARFGKAAGSGAGRAGRPISRP